MLVIDPAGQRQRQAACGRALLAPTICAFPHAQHGGGRLHTSAMPQRQGQSDLEGLAAFAGEKLLLALQRVVGRVVDARARHKRKDARQQKNRHRGLVADGKEPRAAGQQRRGDTSVAIAELTNSTQKM